MLILVPYARFGIPYASLGGDRTHNLFGWRYIPYICLFWPSQTFRYTNHNKLTHYTYISIYCYDCNKCKQSLILIKKVGDLWYIDGDN